MVESRRVANEQDAVDAAAAFGYPIVLKALPPDVAHKSKLGLVLTGLGNEASVKAGYTKLAERLRTQDLVPADVVVIVQPMVAAKAELLIGVTTEAPFGHFLVAGLGGIYAELLDDVVLFPVPITREILRKRLSQCTIGKLAHQIGDDGAVGQVVDALIALQSLVLAHPDEILSIDVNPLLLTERGVVGVDALVLGR